MKTSIGPVVCCPGILFLTLLFSAATRLISAETDAAPANPEDASLAEPASPTNAAGEIRLSQPVIDQLRREIEQSAARNAEAINAGLSLIEPTLARMHERQMEAVQSSNRSILMVVGVFAAVGFGGVIFISLILVRALGRFSELAVMTSPRGPFLGSGQSLAILGAGASASGQGAVEQASGEFQNAIEQLQGRIRELEDSFQSTATEGSVPHSTAAPPARSPPQTPAWLRSFQTS